MSPYDILMIVVLVATTIFGAWKGMAWQLASLASLVLSYFAALKFSPQLAPYISDQAPWNRFLAMLVIYLGTSVAIWLIFRVVANLIDRVKLKEFDHQLGALFGLAKGVLLCVAITFFAASLLAPDQKKDVLHSRSGHYIGLLITKAHTVMPEEIHDVLHPYLFKIIEEDEQLESDASTGSDPAQTASQPGDGPASDVASEEPAQHTAERPTANPDR